MASRYVCSEMASRCLRGNNLISLPVITRRYIIWLQFFCGGQNLRIRDI